MSSSSKPTFLKAKGSFTNIFKAPQERTSTHQTITSKLHLARKKLLPLINEILRTASENASRLPYQASKSYRITTEQFKEVIWSSNVLKEVDEILKFSQTKKYFNKSFKPQQFNFDTENVKVNKNGKIYIDTPILVQLIDLHNMLGEVIDFIKDLPSEGQKLIHEAHKRKLCSSKPIVNCTENFVKKKNTENDKITKEILTSLTLPMNTNFLVMAANSVQRSKTKMPSLPEERSSSEVNITQETNLKIRKIKSTGSDLSTRENSKVVDAIAARKIIVRCMADLDRVKEYLERNKSLSKTSLVEGHTSDESQLEECKCDMPEEQEPLNFIWKEDGENGSKLIICIKGKTGEDGDIHVVIRQCPECKQSDKGDKSGQRFSVSIENLDKLPVNSPSESKREVSREPSRQGPADAINVLFDPDQPSQSIVEGPQIKLYETINMSLKTPEGEDFIISLSVRPKDAEKKSSGFNLHEIFSESRTIIKVKPQVAEKVIPLYRTKVCSSMDFDVNVSLSKLNATGMQHPNSRISRCLEDLGVYNVLRASRPCKCGRQAVLNQHQEKSLPYAASLRSLPLDETDMAVINQSLNMSLHKSKNSKILPDKKPLEQHVRFPHSTNLKFQQSVNFVQIWQQEVQFWSMTEIRKALINRKLNFYIYLENDVQQYEKTYEVRYFEVFKNKNADATKLFNTNKKKKLKASKKCTVSTSYHKNVNSIQPTTSSVHRGKSSKIPIYAHHYLTRMKILYTTKSGSHKIFNNTCKIYECCDESDEKNTSTNQFISVYSSITPKNDQNIISIDDKIINTSPLTLVKSDTNVNSICHETTVDVHKITDTLISNQPQIRSTSSERVNNSNRNKSYPIIYIKDSSCPEFEHNKHKIDDTIPTINNNDLKVISTNEDGAENNKNKIDGFAEGENPEINIHEETVANISQIQAPESNISGDDLTTNNYKTNINSQDFIGNKQRVNNTSKSCTVANNAIEVTNDIPAADDKNYDEDISSANEETTSDIRQEIIDSIQKMNGIGPVLNRTIHEINSETTSTNSKINNCKHGQDSSEPKTGSGDSDLFTKFNHYLINRVRSRQSCSGNNASSFSSKTNSTVIGHLNKNDTIHHTSKILTESNNKKGTTDCSNILNEFAQNSSKDSKLLTDETHDTRNYFDRKFDKLEKFNVHTMKKPLPTLPNEKNFVLPKSVEIFNNFFEKKLPKDKKRKRDFFTSRSYGYLLGSNKRRGGKEGEKLHQNTKGGGASLALSSTRFKKDISLEKTMSKMIVSNLANFLYHSIVQELSIETKLEILSKIDEFLGRYYKFQDTHIESKCRKNKGRF